MPFVRALAWFVTGAIVTAAMAPAALAALAADGVASAVWMDSGTYRVNGSTLSITGNLGPGTWKRIWAPGQESSIETTLLNNDAE